MSEIPLTNGGVTIVDDADYEALSAHRWQGWDNNKGNRYVVRCCRGKTIMMHRAIMEPGRSHVDHRDGDGFNNQRSNLRTCTAAQNLANQRPQRRRNGKSSQFKGVSWNAPTRKWVALCGPKGTNRYLGSFLTEAEAAEAYNEAATRLYGEFAQLNLIAAVGAGLYK